jgi:1,2-diacylglycerol 3-alpha-glucosyltransferase
MKQKVLLVQQGARHRYAVGDMLHGLGILGGLYTDSSSKSFLGRLSVRFPWLQVGPLKRLTQRKFLSIPDELIRSSDIHFLSDVWCWLTRTTISSPYVMASRGASQSRLMKRWGLGKSEVVYCMNADHLEFMKWAKSNGAKVITDVYTHPFMESIVNRVMNELGFREAIVSDDAINFEMARLSECYEVADLVLCPSQWVADGVLRVSPSARDKVRIVPYGSSISFGNERNSPEVGRVFFAGVEVVRKGLFDLSEAVTQLQARGMKVRLRVAGLVPERFRTDPRLKSAEFLGKLDVLEMKREYLAADCVALPSYAEGFPAVVAEAIVAGCPVVVSRECGAPIEDQREGIVLESHSPSEIASKIGNLIENRPFRNKLADTAFQRGDYFSMARWQNDLAAIVGSDSVHERSRSQKVIVNSPICSEAENVGLVDETGDNNAVVVFDNLGPYHIARLKSLSACISVTAIECASESSDYEWVVQEKPEFRTITLVKNAAVKSISRNEFATILFEALDRVRPQVVCVPGWSSRAATMTILWCLSRSVPMVLMSESNSKDANRGVIKEWIKQKLVSCASAAVVGGTQHKEYLVKLGMHENHVFYGYDAVDNDYFQSNAELIRLNRQTFLDKHQLPETYFLVSCRFIPKKNLHKLLEAYNWYVRGCGHAPWKLVILGDGELRTSIEEKIIELDLAKLVSLRGFQQYENLPVYYSLASAFVHPSTIEQWGLVVNEAMASGLPVVVSNTCGCSQDLVRDEVNGFTFDPNSIEDIAKKLTAIADMPESKRTQMGRESLEIVKDFGTERFADGFFRAISIARENSNRKPSITSKLLLKLLGRLR